MLPRSLIARLAYQKNLGAIHFYLENVRKMSFSLGGVLRFRRVACYARVLKAPHNGKVVGLGRLELPTSPLSGVRSNQLSYRPLKLDLFPSACVAAPHSLGHVPDVRSLNRSSRALVNEKISAF